MRLSLPESADAWIARAVTLAVVAGVAGVLLRTPVPFPLVARDTVENPLHVVFLEPPEPPVAVPESSPEPARPRRRLQVHTPLPQPKPAADRAAPPTLTQAEPEVPETDTAPALHPSARGTAPGASALIRNVGATNREAFGRAGRDPLEVAPRTVFQIRDSSIGGRLKSMSQQMDCAELRVALRKIGAAGADSIVRTMQERGCI